MRRLFATLGILFAQLCFAADNVDLPPEKIKALVSAATDASNRMLLSGSSNADVDALFALYSDDFVYVHEAYGGSYTRAQLYKNSVNHLQAGRFKQTEARYKVLNILTGRNAAAAERLEIASGKVHLTVFEFKGDRISKMIEYWK